MTDWKIINTYRAFCKDQERRIVETLKRFGRRARSSDRVRDRDAANPVESIYRRRAATRGDWKPGR